MWILLNLLQILTKLVQISLRKYIYVLTITSKKKLVNFSSWILPIAKILITIIWGKNSINPAIFLNF